MRTLLKFLKHHPRGLKHHIKHKHGQSIKREESPEREKHKKLVPLRFKRV